MTARLADSVVRLCRILPIKHVAELYGLNWKTVKTIDKRHLAESLGPVDLKGVTIIAMDEFALRKGIVMPLSLSSHTSNGIISHCRYPLHTRLLEGINNKIKVI